MAIRLELFTCQLTDSGLMSSADVERLLTGIPPDQQPQDGEELARLLVREKKLTPFQAQQIYRGKGKHLVLGNYIVLDKLGQGGMGMVLKAEHKRMKRIVALKVLSPSVTKTPKILQRFQREVEAVAKLEHPNIVTAHDADEAGGTHFLVMQYVEGTDLSALVKKQGPMMPAQALACIVQTARGLEYAHKRGVVHRDIKPANLLLDRQGTVKILDLGLARLESAGPQQDQLTGTGQIMGTVDFMAPEQATDTRRADARADIYSLGVTLWYLLTGRALYEGETVTTKLLAHQQSPIPSLSQACPAASPALEKVFAKMVAKAPESRYQTMTHVIAYLGCCWMGDASGLAVAPAPGEDSLLQELLCGMAIRPAPAVAMQATENTVAPVPATEATVAFQVPQAEAKPETQPSPDSPLAAPNAKRQPPARRWRLNRSQWIAVGSGALLLLAAIVLFALPKGGLHVKQGDTVIGQGKLPAAWHGWPADAPQPAIAPFTAAQAKKHQEEWAAYLKLPVEYENSLGMKFVLIPPGEFTMGATLQEIGESLKSVGDDKRWQEFIKSETPRHKVVLTQPIYVGIYEVTQKEYEAVMDKNPSGFAKTGYNQEWVERVADLDTANHPVERVRWSDAAEFCAKLSEKEELKPFYSVSGETITTLAGTGYRLPTEAEWESACRAGTTTKYWIGDQDELLVQAGWSGANSGARTHAVGELTANPLGLFDTHGNVWEWVQDWWEPAYYQQFSDKPAVDPSGPSSAGSLRPIRGGDWIYSSLLCRSSVRNTVAPSYADAYVGFRVALTVDAVKQAMQNAKRQPRSATVNHRWRDWPDDAPTPAIASFDAVQIKKPRKAWVDYLILSENDESIGI